MIENYFYFLILPILGVIGYIFYLKQVNNDLYKDLTKEREKNVKLSQELANIKKKDLFARIVSADNETSEDDNFESLKHCDVCGSIHNVKYYPTSGYEEFDGNKTFLSGGFNLCSECLNICEKCSCGKYKIPVFLEEYIGDTMEHPDFCNCYEPEDQKNKRNKNEYYKLQILLSKQKVRNTLNNQDLFT